PQLQFFFVRKGRDLVDGTNRSSLLEMAQSRWGAVKITSPITVAIPSPDSEYVFIVTCWPSRAIARYLPYYLLIFAAVTALCWVLAFQLASPLNGLAEAVRRFGAGDLSARVHSRRGDEIGDVGRAFDTMAERIETLLIAERRLLQDISHELKSPLGRLSFAAELVRTSPDRDAAVARVNKEIDRLSDLVGSLLEVTRTEGNSSERHLESVALESLVRELVENCEIEAAARPCKLIVNGSSHL